MRRFHLTRKTFAVPYAVFLAVFVVVPLLFLLADAFRDGSGAFTMKNFVRFFKERDELLNFLKSLAYGLGTTVICLVIGYPVAYILSNPKFNRSAVLVLLFILPMWINFLLRTYALRVLIDTLGIQYGMGTVFLGMTYDFLPFMILPIYTTLSSIDKSYAEAAEDLGARPYQVLLRTTLPLSVPGIISGVMMVFLPTMSSFVISDYMSNNKITLFGSFINRTYNTVLQNVGSAYSIILLIAIGLTLLASSALNKLFSKGAPVNAGGGGRLW